MRRPSRASAPRPRPAQHPPPLQSRRQASLLGFRLSVRPRIPVWRGGKKENQEWNIVTSLTTRPIQRSLVAVACSLRRSKAVEQACSRLLVRSRFGVATSKRPATGGDACFQQGGRVERIRAPRGVRARVARKIPAGECYLSQQTPPPWKDCGSPPHASSGSSAGDGRRPLGVPLSPPAPPRPDHRLPPRLERVSWPSSHLLQPPQPIQMATPIPFPSSGSGIPREGA